jgi:MFS transporter, OPA family, sugar phosphate sensor protein UhpC
MNSIFSLFRSAPSLPEIEDPVRVKTLYRYWRVRVMYSMFIGYVLYYLTRKSFVYAMPGIIAELHLDKAELGIMGTIFALTYGISKFFNGVLSDQSNPRYFMSVGLILTGVCTILLGCFSSLWAFALFWGLNGWFQGFGWPPCVKLLSHWYSRSERGSWWSSFSVSQNVGGFLAPWIVGICLWYCGWRWAIFLPGIVCIAGGFFLMNRLVDVPRTLGLPPVEKFRNDEAASAVAEEEEDKEVWSGKQILFSVLKNKYVWILAAAYFFVYFVRTGMSDWTLLFMMESKGYSSVQAGGIVSLFEVGGFLGMFSAGWISDRVFCAKRGPVNALFALVLLASLIGFCSTPAGYPWLDSLMMFLCGFGTFGPQMLIGVAVVEFAHKKASATASGLACWIAYLGAALAGYPLGKVIDAFGWQGFFVALLICCSVMVALLFPLWSASQFSKKGSLQEKRSAT